MKEIRILLLKIVNQSMDKLLEKNICNLAKSPGAGHSLLATCIFSLLLHFCEHP